MSMVVDWGGLGQVDYWRIERAYRRVCDAESDIEAAFGKGHGYYEGTKAEFERLKFTLRVALLEYSARSSGLDSSRGCVGDGQVKGRLGEMFLRRKCDDEEG